MPIFLLVGLFSFVLLAQSTISSAVIQATTPTSLNLEFANVSEKVLAYQPIIEQYANEYGVSEYVPIIMAIMMQESGGNGNDPMQSSESKCGKIGCINNPIDSIKQGVKHFANVLNKANGNLLVAIQAYNYGTNFIDWIIQRGGEYSNELAIEYSRELYEKEVRRGRGDLYSCAIGDARNLGACYGDYLYVQHVLRYTTSIPVSGEGLGTGTWKNPLPIPLKITSPFGSRIHPISGKTEFHSGVDFSCNGSHLPIRAVDNGIVTSAGVMGGYGNTVLIQHESNLFSLYAHLNSINVYPGQKVDSQTQIGTCGTTGISTGIHLHLEARTSPKGGHINPIQLLQ